MLQIVIWILVCIISCEIPYQNLLTQWVAVSSCIFDLSCVTTTRSFSIARYYLRFGFSWIPTWKNCILVNMMSASSNKEVRSRVTSVLWLFIQSMGLVSWVSYPSHVSEFFWHWDVTWRTVDMCVTLVVNDHVQNLKWIVSTSHSVAKSLVNATRIVRVTHGRYPTKEKQTLSLSQSVKSHEIVVSSGRVEVLKVVISASEFAWMHKIRYHDKILISFGEKLITLQEFKP